MTWQVKGGDPVQGKGYHASIAVREDGVWKKRMFHLEHNAATGRSADLNREVTFLHRGEGVGSVRRRKNKVAPGYPIHLTALLTQNLRPRASSPKPVAAKPD
jgi:hypothetical protein